MSVRVSLISVASLGRFPLISCHGDTNNKNVYKQKVTGSKKKMVDVPFFPSSLQWGF